MKLAKSVRNISLALVLSALAAGGAAAQQTLKLGHSQPAGHPYDLGFKRFADTVAKDTDGRIKIEVYPSSQLGEAVERIEGLRIGALDLTEGAFSHASQFCPELGLFGAPFLFSSQAQFAAVMDGEVGEELDRICNDRFGIRLLATFTSGNRLLFNSKRPIETAADLEGLKVRVMGGEADAMTWQVFGAIPAPMPYSEVYSALQAGVIDGAENEPASILANRFYEAAPYFAITDHLVLPIGLWISDRVYSGLSPEDQDILRIAAREAAVWQRDYITTRNAEAIEEMKEKYGVTVSSLDASELREKGADIQDQVAERLGVQDMLEKVRNAETSN